MKKRFRKTIRPSNRRVRILVGLLLVGFLIVQVSQSVATDSSATATLQTVDGETILASDSARFETICRLAETDHLALLNRCRAELQNAGPSGYTTTFVKQERIRGKLTGEQSIEVKFLAQPFSVAMAWTKNAPVGDRLVYVEGKCPDSTGRSQMVVRPKSPFLRQLVNGSVRRLPDGPDAMKNTLRPCTMFGFRNSLDSLIEVYETARAAGDCSEQWGYRDETTGRRVKFVDIDGRTCVVLVRYLPQKDEYPAKKTVICIDLGRLLPMRVIGYDWDDQLLCNYEYHDVNFDVALGPEDFTPQANGIRAN